MFAPAPFETPGAAPPATPLVVTVPHAGRDYPAALRAELRVPVERLVALEDRFADLLVDDVRAAGATVLVAQRARAWIDLNRDPAELDPAMVTPAPHGVVASARVRGGLGIVPRRVAEVGEIYRAPLPLAAVQARILADHAGWHAAIADALATAHARFGVAMLIDCHSMPPLRPGSGAAVVIGDRHGRSAGGSGVGAVERALAGHGAHVVRNTPYAGAYTLARHGRPDRNIHAIQLEFCRTLYLDGERTPIEPGLSRTRRWLALAAEAFVDALSPALPLAAE